MLFFAFFLPSPAQMSKILPITLLTFHRRTFCFYKYIIQLLELFFKVFLSSFRTVCKQGLRFGDVLPLILTDNGGEFADIFAVELDLNGQKESDLVFCDPMQSCQKPRVEKNHTLFRDVVQKGESFDNFTQSTVNLIFSHVNSVKRKSLNGKTPYEMFTFTYGEKVAEIFGIAPIPAAQVVQSPKLLNA
jgi:hypothetical protein